MTSYDFRNFMWTTLGFTNLLLSTATMRQINLPGENPRVVFDAEIKGQQSECVTVDTTAGVLGRLDVSFFFDASGNSDAYPSDMFMTVSANNVCRQWGGYDYYKCSQIGKWPSSWDFSYSGTRSESAEFSGIFTVSNTWEICIGNGWSSAGSVSYSSGTAIMLGLLLNTKAPSPAPSQGPTMKPTLGGIEISYQVHDHTGMTLDLDACVHNLPSCNLLSAFTCCLNSLLVKRDVQCDILLPLNGDPVYVSSNNSGSYLLEMNFEVDDDAFTEDSGVHHFRKHLRIIGNNNKIVGSHGFNFFSGRGYLNIPLNVLFRNFSVVSFGDFTSVVKFADIKNVEIDSCSFTNSLGSAMTFSGWNDDVVIRRSSFYENYGSDITDSAVIFDLAANFDVEIEFSSFVNNHGYVKAGALYMASKGVAFIYVIACKFDNNMAPYSSAIHLSSATSTPSTFLTITDSFVTDHITPAVYGAVYISSRSSISSMFITNTTFKNNTAAMYVFTADSTTKTIFEITDCSVTDHVHPAVSAAVHISSGSVISDVLILQSEFTNNIGAAGALEISTKGKLKLQATRSLFDKNKGYSSGGAVTVLSYNGYNSTVDFNDCDFVSNECSKSGGALAIIGLNGRLKILSSKFASNFAIGDGGAVYIKGNMPTYLYDTKFMNNSIACPTQSSACSGGALMSSNNTFQPIYIDNCTFAFNQAPAFGGAVRATDIYAINSKFHRNEARVGGALSLYTFGRPFISGCNFTSNYAIWAGAVEATSSAIALFNNLFAYNKAASDGGAVWLMIANGTIPVPTLPTLMTETSLTWQGNIQCTDGNALTYFRYQNPQRWKYTCSYPSFPKMITSTIESTANVNTNNGVINVACPSGYYMQGYKVTSLSNIQGYNRLGTIKYTCVLYKVPRFDEQCISLNTQWDEYLELIYLDRHDVLCPADFFLKEFSTEFKENRLSKFRFSYKCCNYFLSTVNTRIEDSKFVGNTASRGGALYMTLSTTIKIVHSSFLNSSALMGGAIYFDTPRNIEISKSSFENNRALSIESFAKFTANPKSCLLEPLPKWKEDQAPNLALSPVNCDTSDDFSSIGQGGGVFFSRSNFASLIENAFGSNAATKDGGAMIFKSSRDIAISSSQYSSNSAGSVYDQGNGGAVHLSSCQRFAIKSSLLANNSATAGGAIFVDKSSAISIGGSLPLIYSIACQACSNRPISTSEPFEFQSVLLATPSYISFGSNVHLQYLRGRYIPGSMLPNWISKVNNIVGNLPGMNGEPPMLYSERDYVTFFVNSVFNTFSMTVFPVDIDDFSTIPTKAFKNYTVVESLSHPYRHGEHIYSQKIMFASSTYKLEFDSETKTELSYDLLTVHRGSPLGEVLYSNSGNEWPSITVESTDGIIISFYSDDSVSFWGFKVTISLLTPSPSQSSLNLLKNMSDTSSLVTFVGNTARSAGGAVEFDTSNENVLIVKGTVFKENSVLDGGGGAVSLMNSNRNFFVYSSTFQSNSARMGGAVYVGRANMIIQFYNILFETNNAYLNGGAIYTSVNNGDGILSSDSPTGMMVYFSHFIGNKALGSGGCIYAYQYNVLHIYFSTLSENYCGLNGGALYQNFGYLHTGGCKFQQNTAGSGGGALYMEASQAYVLQPNTKLEFTVFENNTALYGGGAYLSLNSALNTSGLTIFDSNNAVYGGAIRLLDSVVYFLESVAKSFTEQVSYVPETYYFRHIFEVENSRFSSSQVLTTFKVGCNNVGVLGGFSSSSSLHYTSYCVKLRANVNFTVTKSITSRNVFEYGTTIKVMSVQCGDGSYLLNASSVNMSFTCASFEDNHGVMRWSQCLSYTASNFTQSSASTPIATCPPGYALTSFNGHFNGFFAYRMSYVCCTANVFYSQLFLNNIAKQGSVLYLGPSTSCNVSAKNAASFPIGLNGNKNGLYGGTIFVMKELSSPQLRLDIGRNAFNIQESTGLFWMTQPVSIRAQSTTFILKTYFTSLNPYPIISTFDAFGNLNVSDSTSIITVQIVESNCQGGTGLLSGASFPAVTLINGTASFDNLNAVCFPGGDLTLLFSMTPAGMDSKYALSTSIDLKFRTCIDGEVLFEGQCQTCPEGTYSLKYTPTAVCNPMPSEGVASCYGDKINVAPGFWRISAMTTTMLECTRPKTCLGGTGFNASLNARTSASLNARTSASLRSIGENETFLNISFNPGCLLGSTGILCSTCLDAYYYSPFDDICLPCAGSSGPSQLALIICIPLAMVLFLFGGVYCFATNTGATGGSGTGDANNSSAFSLGGMGLDELNEAFEELQDTIEQVQEFLTAVFEDIMPKIKILVTVSQVICNLPSVLNLKFPPFISNLFSSLSFINFSGLSLGSPECYTRFDYVDQLISQTAVPIVITLMIPVMFYGEVTYRRIYDPKIRSQIFSRYITCFFLLTYVVLPSTTIKIFGMFTCVSIDPDNTIPGTPLVMKNSVNVSCESSRYQLGVLYALVMLVVYPIGIPFFYFYVLYINKEDISRRKWKRVGDAIVIIEEDEAAATKDEEVKTDTNTNLEKADDKESGTHIQELSHTKKSKPIGDQAVIIKEMPIDEVAVAVQAEDEQEKMALNIVSSNNLIKADNIKFLYKAYEPKYWYWEVLETSRRLLLTAVISIIADGEIMQIVFGAFIALIFMKLYGMYAPFLKDDDDALQELSQYQIFITLFISLLLRVAKTDPSTSGDSFIPMLDVLLVLCNMATYALFSYQIYKRLTKAEEEINNAIDEQKAEDDSIDKAIDDSGDKAVDDSGDKNYVAVNRIEDEDGDLELSTLKSSVRIKPSPRESFDHLGQVLPVSNLPLFVRQSNDVNDDTSLSENLMATKSHTEDFKLVTKANEEKRESIDDLHISTFDDRSLRPSTYNEKVVEQFEDGTTFLIVEETENDIVCDGSIDSVLSLFPEDFLSMDSSIESAGTKSAESPER